MKIHGLKEVLNALTVDEKAIGDALQEGGEIILQQAKDNVSPKDSTVASSYNMTVTRNENGWLVDVGSNMELAAFFEWGTGEHVVVPPETTDAYTMQWFKTGRGTLHAYPHLLPAFRQNRDKVVELIKKSLTK